MHFFTKSNCNAMYEDVFQENKESKRIFEYIGGYA